MGCFGSNETNKVASSDVENSNKFGEKKIFDPNFKGPTKNRSCTDIICCVIFIVFLVGEVIVAYFAFTFGDPSLLLHPSDSSKNLCGYKSQDKKPYLLFFDITRCASLGPAIFVQGGCPTPSICVEKCPTSNWVWLTLYAEEGLNGGPLYTKRKSELQCLPNVNLDTDTTSLEVLVASGKCAPYTVESEAVASRCFPSLLLKGTKLAGDALMTASGEILATGENETITDSLLKEGSVIFEVTAVAEKVMNDVVNSAVQLGVAFLIAMIVAFIYIVLLRLLAGCFVWFTLAAFFIAFLGSAAYCYYRYFFIASDNITSDDVKFHLTADGWKSYLNYKEVWLAFAIIASIFVLVFLIIIIFLRKRLLLAIALVGQASKAVAAITWSLFFPILLFAFQLAVLGFSFTIVVYLLSSNKPVYGPISSNTTITNGTAVDCSGPIYDINMLQCQFFQYTGEHWAISLQFYNIFVFLWLMNFVSGMGQISLAGAFSSWYWAWEKPDDVPNFPIMAGLWRSFRYHPGTVAFGAFLIAIVQLIRLILEYIDRKVKGAQNPCAKFCLCCLKCCFWCLEKFMKFITKNAYIMVAIYGKNFCVSAKEAFFLLMRNIVRVVVVDNVTGFVLFIGKILVVGSVTTFAYFFFNLQIPWLSNYAPQGLNYFFVPVILVAIGSFFIAYLFFSVFDFAVDTLFLCVMEDLERHDGSPDKPYFMSKNLMELLCVENKFKGSETKKEGCGLCCC